MTQAFKISDRAPKKEPFHYVACGLDDVYLLNGFTLSEIDGEPTVSIENMDALHRAIGFNLIRNRKRLRSKDIRFLRKEMDLTQNEFAQLLGTTDQAVARWEKGKTPIPGPADRLARVLFAVHCLTPEQKAKLVDEFEQRLLEIQHLDETGLEPTFFRQSQCTWFAGRG